MVSRMDMDDEIATTGTGSPTRRNRATSQILVIDDELAIRDFVRSFLEDEGYSVLVGRDGADALHLIRAHRPDLVLMDVMMPGLSGREVVRQLHEHPVYAAIPVILMSAAARWDQAVDAPVQFLSKPFDLDRLLGMITGALHQRPKKSSPSLETGPPPESRNRTTWEMSWTAAPYAFTDLD